MRLQQLPLFNTAYADRDGHFGYVYNATLPVHATGDYRYWQGVVPGDRSDLIATTIVTYDSIPKVFDPPTGWIQNSNDMPWTSVYPPMLDSTKFAPGFAAPQAITQRAQRGTRILSTAPAKMTFEDVKRGKLDTHVETADQFVDALVATARSMGTDRAKKAADVLRFRCGNSDLPGHGAPSMLGAIRTINVGPFVDGKTQAVSGDTFFAVIEFSTPQRAEALLGYGNWSKKGSTHVDDQLPLLSRKEMRPVWRARKDIEANLESRKVF